MNILKLFIMTLSTLWIQTNVWSNPTLDDISKSTSVVTILDKQGGGPKNSGFYIGTTDDSSSEFMKLYIHSSLGENREDNFKVTAAEANVRQGPSTDSRRLVTVHFGAEFRKVSDYNRWTQVLVPKHLVVQKGYCHFDDCKLEDNQVRMTRKAYLYAFPSDISLKLRQFENGEKFKHVVSYEPWRRVQIGPMPTEIQAYIHGSLVQVNDGVVVVTSAYARVRKGPSTSYREMYVAKRGDKFMFLNKSASWIHIAVPDTYANAVRQEIQMGEVTNIHSALNLRSGPGTNNPVIGILRNRQRFEILGRHKNWYKINYRATVGWVYKTYVRLLGNSPDLPIPDTSSSQPSNNPQQPPLPAVQNPSPIHPSDHSSTDTSRLGNNVVTRGSHVEIRGVPEFAQRGRDPYSSDGSSWRPHAYCGPTSMQIVLAYHGVQKSRDWIAMTHPSNGKRIQSSSHRGQIYAKGAGAAYAPMVNLAKKLGFKGSKQVWTNNLNTVKNMIKAGRPQIISVAGRIRYKGGGSWNSNGHIMVIRGFDSAGDVIVNDPAGNGSRKVIRRSDFMRIWRGFTVDIRKD